MDSNPIIHPYVDYVLIPLSKNKGFTKVSPEDMDLAQSYKWYLLNGYASTEVSKRSHPTEGGNKLYLHRLILKPPNGLFTDHINGDRLDNRRSNLREATFAQNSRNTPGNPFGRISKYKGVNRVSTTNRWKATITADGVFHYLGCYETEEEAAAAYDSAASYFFKEYAYTNFPCPIPLSPKYLIDQTPANKNKFKHTTLYFENRSQRWMVKFWRKRHCRHIGSFRTKEMAIVARDKALVLLQGDLLAPIISEQLVLNNKHIQTTL